MTKMARTPNTQNGFRAEQSRRQLIGRMAMAGFSAPVIASIVHDMAFAQDATPLPEDILRELGKNPALIPRGTTNFETPLELVESLLTPNELFFIRSNGPISLDIAAEDWSLTVSGLVDRELELSLADIQGMESRTITAFLECSGNARSRFDPQAEGSQWGNGAIGNAEWTGVSLIDVLDMAGVQMGAVDLVSQGADFSEMQRGLPLEVAGDPDVMLVWEMNGEPLPAPHGGPVRLLVPGWGGIASTKWIVGVEVIDRPFDGHFNTESYVIINEDGTILRPVREVPVYSVITSPAPGEALATGEQAVAGFAWSGYAGIARVDVSIDGGDWQEAEIVEEAGPLSWVRFTLPWNAESGEHTLRSRATDQIALTQPVETVWNAKGYLMNAILDVPVTVS